MRKEGFGTLLVFLTAVISGFSIFANKFFVVELDAMVFTAVRAIILGVVFLGLSLYFNSWKLKENKKTNWGYLLLIGLVGGGLAFLLFFNGLKLTTSGRAAFLHKTLPFFVLLLAGIFLKERITKKQWMALVAMFIGIIAMNFGVVNPGEFWQDPQMGDFLVLTATFLWAVENVAAKKAMIKGEHNFVVSFVRMFFGAVLLWGVILLTNKLELIFELTIVQWRNIFVSALLLFFYVLTYYWSVRLINVSKAATILLLAPVVTLVLGAAFLGEPISFLQMISSVLILAGAYLITQTRSEFARV